MKRILKIFAIETIAIFLVSQIAAGIIFEKGLQSIIVTGFALTVTTFLVRPIINLLLLPLNIMTFGLLRWVSHAITLFIIDKILSEFAITGFSFGGAAFDFVSLPAVNFSSGPMAYIGFSFLLALVTTIVYALVD